MTASIATFSSNAAVKYISPGLASIAQNTDIIGSSAKSLEICIVLWFFLFRGSPTGQAVSITIDVLMLTQN